MKKRYPNLSQISFKKTLFISLILGSALALSQAPVYFFPILFISFTGLLVLTDKSPPLIFKRVFCVGWIFGFGYHTAGLYWIAFALGIDLAQFWWLVPFTVLGLPAFLGLWSGMALAVTFKVFQKRDSCKFQAGATVFLFASLWALGEWLRGHLFTGFPWNLMGYTWLFSNEMLQVTSVIGIYGLTALTILLGCAPYGVIREKRLLEMVVMVCLFVCLWSGGAFWLRKNPTQYHEDIGLRIVQPNISQTFKWDAKRVQENYSKLLRLSQDHQGHSSSGIKVTHVIWPESALPFYLEEEPWRRSKIMEALPEKSILLTGGLRREMVHGSLLKIWNSFLVIGSEGEVLATYDKAHLVPFGEYVPLRAFIPGLVKKVTHGTVDFSKGEGPQTVTVNGTPGLSPLICYEGIFPGNVTGTPRPQWMVNVTNDAWYGKTSGPYQHFGSVRVRSIEEGLPLVRVANTGLSGVFDAYGRVIHSLKLNETGIIDTKLPKPHPTPTLFSRFGDLGFALIIFLMLIFSRVSFSQHLKSVPRND